MFFTSSEYIPTIAGLVVTSVAEGSVPMDEMMFCVYVKGAIEVPKEALETIKNTFADEKYKVQIGNNIDLWQAQ